MYIAGNLPKDAVFGNIFINSQLQLGTGKTAGWLVGRMVVRRVSLSVCPRYVWPYLGNGSSDRLRFWHTAEGRQAR